MPLINSATLVTEFKADTRNFHNNVNSLGRTADTLRNKFSKLSKSLLIGVGAATAGFAGLVVMINNAAEKIDRLGKVSDQLNILPEQLQFIQLRAELAGLSIEGINKALRMMSRRLGDAKDGLSTATRSFEKLGLSVDNLLKMDAEEQFNTITKAIAGVQNATIRLQVAQEIFGPRASEILNLVKDDVKTLREEFDSFGVGLSKDQVKNVESYNDSWTRLSYLFDSFQLQLTSAIAPAFEAINVKIMDFIKSSGGLKVVAQEVAKVMLSVTQAMITGFGQVVRVIENIKLVTLETIQLLDKVAQIGGYGTALRGKLGLLSDEEAVSRIGRLDRRSQEIDKIRGELSSSAPIGSGLVKQLEDIKSSMGTDTAKRAAEQKRDKLDLNIGLDDRGMLKIMIGSQEFKSQVTQEIELQARTAAQTVR